MPVTLLTVLCALSALCAAAGLILSLVVLSRTKRQDISADTLDALQAMIDRARGERK